MHILSNKEKAAEGYGQRRYGGVAPATKKREQKNTIKGSKNRNYKTGEKFKKEEKNGDRGVEPNAENHCAGSAC